MKSWKNYVTSFDAGLNDTEGSERGPAATRDLSTQADEASGSQKVLV